METKKKIVDASVVVKWFLDEAMSVNAVNLRSQHLSSKLVLTAPDLLLYEVANVLRYKKFSEEDLRNAIESLFDVQLHIEKTTEFLLKKAGMLALAYGISVYDASYIALADFFQAELITADQELVDKKLPNVVYLKQA